MKKMLIVYYSWSNGNTKKIAEEIQQTTGADIVRIDTKTPYTGGYDAVVAQGQEEVQRGYEPPIKDLGIRLEDYDVIAIGTPTWWYTMAPAVRAFLRQYDLTGKRVYAFQTHGGQPGRALKDIRMLSKGENIGDFSVEFDSMGGSKMKTTLDDLRAWIAAIQ